MKFQYILFLLFSSSIFSQNIPELKTKAMDQAQQVALASITKNYDTILKYTHPKILKKYGKEKLKDGIDEVFHTMETQHIKILSSEIESVSDLREENKEFRCVITNNIRMDYNGKLFSIVTSLFGFYNQKKEQWYFVESNKLLHDPQTKSIFKNFKTKIKIPEDQQFVEN